MVRWTGVVLVGSALWWGGVALGQERAAGHGFVTGVSADSAPQGADVLENIVKLGTVTVQGRQPGPRLWRVTKGDHTLWVLATLSPLPNGLEWDSTAVVERVKASQAVLWLPSFSMGVDAGFFSKVYLGYKFLQVTRNPDGKTLKEVLPEATYARWAAVKPQLLGRNSRIERFRPIVAAEGLYGAALKKLGLSESKNVLETVRATAKESKIPLVVPELSVKAKEPKKLLALASRITLNGEIECLNATLDTLQNDLPVIRSNALAWAQGDVGGIHVERLRHRNQVCQDVFFGSELMRAVSVSDVESQVQTIWLNKATEALAKNRTTFAVLPFSNISGPRSYLKALENSGYTVIAPQ